MICLGHDSAGNEISPSAGIYGIYKINGNISAVFNTIYIDGVSSDNTQATAAFRKLNTNTDTLVNNILVNQRSCETAMAMIRHYGGFFNNTMGMFCDGNDYFAGGQAGSIATCDNGNSPVSTILELQQAWPGSNVSSTRVNPVFINNGGSSVLADLHLTTGNNCFINNTGIYYPGLPSDIDNESRNQQHPDPGADEIEAVYPGAPVAGDNVRVCAGEPIPSLHAAGTGLIKWYLDSLLYVLGHRGDTFNCIDCLPGLHIYNVTDSVSGCESHPVTMYLIIDTTGSAGHISGDTILCYGQAAW